MLLTKTNTIIIGQVAVILGLLMDGIFRFTSGVLGIQNIGICIILFTIIIYAFMTPLTIRSQKFSKMTAVMNPEIQAINKKYRNKKDQVSMMKMNEETQAVYAKYGVSPMGTCLPLLIQMPILFALYRVVWNIPAYISSVKDAFFPLVDSLLKTEGSQKFLSDIVGNQVNFERLGYTANTAVDALYKFNPSNWAALTKEYPALGDMIAQTTDKLDNMNYFIGMNISNSPMNVMMESFRSGKYVMLIAALLIPVLAGLTQWLNLKLMPQASSDNNGTENNVANSMKTINNMMPLISVFFCITLPIGLGIYWIVSAVVRSIQQIAVNKHLEKMDVDEMVKKNLEKLNEKRKKQGLPPQKISSHAKVNLKEIEKKEEVEQEEKINKRIRNIKESTDYYNNADVKPGSIAAKARMVQKYNEKNEKNRK